MCSSVVFRGRQTPAIGVVTLCVGAALLQCGCSGDRSSPKGNGAEPPGAFESFPEPPEEWPWDKDPSAARTRARAIEKLEEHGGWVKFFDDEREWWEYRRPRPLPPPKRSAVRGASKLVKSISFGPTYVQGAPEEEAGITIPSGVVEEPVTVPDAVDDDLLLNTLPHLPDCRRLSLGLTRVTDRGLSVIRRMPYLHDLFLDYQWTHRYPVLITDQGMEVIGEHRGLRNVALTGAMISNEGIAAVANSQSIECLCVRCCPVTSHCFLSIAKMPRIRELEFEHDERLVVPRERSPDFSQPISEEVAEAVASLDGRLEELTLGGLEVHPSLLRAIARINSLKSYRGPPLEGK